MTSGHRIIQRALLLLAFAAATVSAAETAQTLVTTANATALASHKNVLVLFHASWCGWCRKLDAMLADDKVGPVIQSHFVVTHVDVLEHEEALTLNTPGGTELMESLGGKGKGLPFFAFTDASGKLIVNSLRQPGNENVGYPAQPEEIDWFLKMLRQSAPDVSETETATTEKWLRDHAH